MDEIKSGDFVVMNDRYWVSDKNKGVAFKVRSNPFEICGIKSVLLEGRSGGYALDGFNKVN